MPRAPSSLNFGVGIVEESDVERRRIGIRRDDVVGEIAVDRRAVARVVVRVLEERHADAHHDRAFDLVARRVRVEDPAGVDDRHDATHAQPRDLGLPRNLDELRAVRVDRIFLLQRIVEAAFCAAAARSPHASSRLRGSAPNGTPLDGASPLRCTRPSLNARCSRLRARERRIVERRGARQHRLNGRARRVGDRRNHRCRHHRAARNRPGRQRGVAETDFDPVERDAGLLRRRAARASCTCRCRCPACRRRRAPCRRREARRWLRRRSESPASCTHRTPQPSVRPSRFIEPTPGVRCDQPNFSAPVRRHSVRCREENGKPVLSSTFGSLLRRNSTGSMIQLDREFVHRRFDREQAGHGAWPAHRGRRTDIALRRAPKSRAGSACCRGTGVASPQFSAYSSSDRALIQVVVTQRRERAVRIGAQAHALLRDRPVADVLEHHLAVHDELHGRPSVRAAAAASSECGHGHSLPPKPEPRYREITRTFSCGTPSICSDVPDGSRSPASFRRTCSLRRPIARPSRAVRSGCAFRPASRRFRRS